jgi:hypothetical protein
MCSTVLNIIRYLNIYRVVEEVHTHNYTYIGRVKAHSSTITGMDFGYRDGVEVEIPLNPFYYFINAL